MDTESPSNLTSQLHQLVQDYGLISVLEELTTAFQARAQRISQSFEQGSGNESREESEALNSAACALRLLIKALPDGIDVEMALENLLHPGSTSSEPQDEQLPSGME